MRARLTLLVAATTVLVLLAFLIPMALLVRQVAADRALSRADDVVQTIVPLTGDPEALRLAVGVQPVPVSVFLPDGRVLGAPASPTPARREPSWLNSKGVVRGSPASGTSASA